MLVKNNIKKAFSEKSNNKTFQEIQKPSLPFWSFFQILQVNQIFPKNQAVTFIPLSSPYFQVKL